MKKLLLILIFAIIASVNVFAQTPLEIEKIKNASKVHLIKNLNNPSSYQSVKWSKVEKTYSTFEDSKEAKLIQDTIDLYVGGKSNAASLSHSAKMRNYSNYEKDSTYLKYYNLELELDSAILKINAVKDKKEKAYKGIFTGYSIDHSFRARNSYNALVLNNWYFILNKSFKVIDAGDADELEDERQKLLQKIQDL
jgi:hypothetical protein